MDDQLLAWYQAAVDRDDPTAAPALAFALAEWLHDKTACWPDPCTHRRRRFPMGRDVAAGKHLGPLLREAFAHTKDCVWDRYMYVLDRLRQLLAEEFRARARVDDIHVVEDTLVDTSNDLEPVSKLFPDDILGFEEMVVPFVLGFPTPLTPRDAEEVVAHLVHAQDTDAHEAQKLAGAFAAANAGLPAVAIHDVCVMTRDALEFRIRILVKQIPEVVSRALHTASLFPKDLPRGFPALAARQGFRVAPF